MARLFIDTYRDGHFIGFMDDLLRAVDPTGDRFEWLVTDVSGYAFTRTNPPQNTSSWLLEREFSAPTFDILHALNEVSVQYQFAVFSAFRLAEAPDPNFLAVYPKIENRPVLYSADVEPQHPQALFEIVQCDNSYACAICRNDHWLEFIRRKFPEATETDPFESDRPD